MVQKKKKIADNQQLSGASRLAEISQFVEAINALPNPFIYGILYSREDHPDIPVHIVPQFAQRGEDLIVDSLRRVLLGKIGDPNTRFTYLEIGANHPVAGSSTFLFYANGNRGTLVEANPQLIPSLRNSRPDDKIIQAAVVPGHIETVDLFVANRSELSSLRSDIAETFEGAEVVERLIVPAINVNELISTMWDPQAITFLSIDVEGLDFEILEAVNLENFPFDIIQIEASDNLIHGNSRRIAGYLERSGYQFVNETEVHLIFVAGDSLQLRKRQGLSSAENLASFGKVNFDSKYASHDLFDTLIARRGVTADSALIRLREKYGSLVDQRIALDNGERSLSQMYAEAGLPDDMLEEEIRLEVDECIPIVKNIERVQDGDLIISDTYFSREVLQQLLKKAGIKKRVGLYSSNLDKYQGKVWSRLSSLPRLHVGDNEHSDIHMAEQSGVATLLVQNFCLSDWETTIEEFSVPLARFLREIRLRCSSTKYSTWQRAQQEFNVLMMLSAAVLVKKLDREPVFLGRDCQQLSKIYRSLYGVGSYLPFSRRFAYDSDTASRYLLENVDSKQVIVDLVSTGRTWSLLSIPRDVHVMIESDDYQYSGELSRPERFSSEFKTSKIGPTSLIWEVLNCADHGMALGAGDLNLGWVRFAEQELPLEFVRSMHEVTDSMVASLEHFEIDELIPDPEVIFLLAHNRLVEFVDNHREVFDSIRLTEIENIADLRGSSGE